MILADDVLSWVTAEREHPLSPAQRANADAIAVAIGQSHRFVLSPAVQALVERLRGQPVPPATLFLPSPLTWIEWEHPTASGIAPERARRMGFLLIGAEGRDLHGGAMLIVYKLAGNPALLPIGAEFCLTDAAPCRRAVGGEEPALALERQWSIRTGNPAASELPAVYAECGEALLAILALVNSPKVTHWADGQDLSRLNRAREKREQRPYLTWRTVQIVVDEPAKDVTCKDETRQMPLHFVRSYLQRNHGELRLVRCHWRGAERIGRVLSNYRALTMAERKAS